MKLRTSQNTNFRKYVPPSDGLLEILCIFRDTLIKYSRYVKVSCNDLNPVLPCALVHPLVELVKAGDEELHDAALGCLPEQPGQVEHAGLEREHENDPLVVLVMGHPVPVSMDVILPEAGHWKVLTQSPVESKGQSNKE